MAVATCQTWKVRFFCDLPEEEVVRVVTGWQHPEIVVRQGRYVDEVIMELTAGGPDKPTAEAESLRRLDRALRPFRLRVLTFVSEFEEIEAVAEETRAAKAA